MTVTCTVCSKIFLNKGNLMRHQNNVHKMDKKNIISYDFEKFNNKCLEQGCNTSYRLTNDLRYHLEESHALKMEKETMNFSCKGDFETWFNDICAKNNLGYFQKEQLDKNRIYFNCNRSGKYTGKFKDRKRALKSQGSCKIGNNCVSQIILMKNNDNTTYQATYYKSHYGHLNQIQHVPLPKQKRIEVASNLTSGVSATKVLDMYRNNFVEDNLSRVNLITRQDIHNIKSAFHIDIQDGVQHKNDNISVDILIRQCQEAGNEVLLYKKQGENHPRLRMDDFCLIFMNMVQEQLLKKFGKSVIAIDSTHGLNMYDFELTTIMVLDELGEGFPAACMFTNRKDTLIYEIFFEAIKLKCDTVINPKVFMSDITAVFINAWLNVMGGANNMQQLYCSWHIDRAWRCHLNKISNLDKRKQTYQTLKVLQNTLDIEDFEKKLISAVQMFISDPETNNFGTYIRDNYVNNRQMWAYCYRKNCGINTNMILESMHKTVKYFYLEGKIVKRLDKGITAVLKYVRDKIVFRIIKLTKGYNNSHIQNIHKRHRSALTSFFDIHLNDENIWTVRSNNNEYVVSKKNPCEVSSCQLRCSFCQICIHEYDCTCVDFYIKAMICKHIHFIHLKLEENGSGGPLSKVNLKQTCTQSATTELETSQCIAVLADRNCNTDVNLGKEKIKTELTELRLQIDLCENTDLEPILPHILKTLKNTKSLLSLDHRKSNNLYQENHLSQEGPANKKIKKQISFFSTKKKNKISSTISKPSMSQSFNISQNLNILSDHDYC